MEPTTSARRRIATLTRHLTAGRSTHTGGKRILITGAGTGIGRAAALALAKRGHTVYATTVSEAQARGINLLGVRGLSAFKLDVTDTADCNKITSLDLDVLLNNAGVGYSGSLAEVDLDLVRKNYEVNCIASLRLTQLALKKMIPARRGTIMFVSSIGGRVPFPFVGSYCMTKYALEAAGEALRAEMEHLGANIKVCLIEPGPYSTGFNQSIMGNKFDWMKQRGRSYWSAAQVAELEKSDKEQLAALESGDISTIVDKIVTACEAAEPEVRYVAPEGIFKEIVKPAEIAR